METTKKVAVNSKETKVETTAKKEFVKLNESEITAILKGIVIESNDNLSMSALKKQESALTEKYGKSNWISIRAYYQSILQNKVSALSGNVLASIKDYNNALIDAWNRINTNKDFVELATFIGMDTDTLAKTWKNGASFVASTYPTIIDNMPARKVSYVSEKAGYIIDAIKPSNLDASKVPAILCACIRNIRKTANKGLKKATYLSVSPARYTDGQIVSVYNAKEDKEKVIIKGESVSKAIFDKIAKSSVTNLLTLTDYRNSLIESDK